MTNEEQKMFKTFINMREEIAINRFKNNLQYLELYAQQEKTENMVEELFQRFEREERIAIHRHYEGEIIKHGFEVDEVYLQGLRTASNFWLSSGSSIWR
jgi:hypothetical protein